MNSDQNIVYLYGQIALFNAEIAGMQAENAMRAHKGEVPAYDESAFKECISRYECVIGHNAIIGSFHR